jgi:hypothetical protein
MLSIVLLMVSDALWMYLLRFGVDQDYYGTNKQRMGHWLNQLRRIVRYNLLQPTNQIRQHHCWSTQMVDGHGTVDYTKYKLMMMTTTWRRRRRRKRMKYPSSYYYVWGCVLFDIASIFCLDYSSVVPSSCSLWYDPTSFVYYSIFYLILELLITTVKVVAIFKFDHQRRGDIFPSLSPSFQNPEPYRG